MPKFQPVPDITLEDSIAQIISSIAMEELALSHIMNAEGEKLQFVLGTLESSRSVVPPPSVSLDDLLKVNDSIKSMLSTVSMNQMFLLGKLSAAVEAYSRFKDCESCDSSKPKDPQSPTENDPPYPDDPNDDEELPLRNGEGPYDTRVSEDDWEHKSFSMVLKIKAELGEPNPQITVYESGSIKLQDVLYGNDFAGLSVRAQDAALSQHFRIGKDKVGDDAINYTYYPDLSEWDAARPGLPVVEKTLILSKAGYEDAKIRVILRYDGSLYTEG